MLAQFVCPTHNVYVCGDCFDEHKDHVEESIIKEAEMQVWPQTGLTNTFLTSIARADSIKNHLASLFNEWLHLQSYAHNTAMPKLMKSIQKHDNLINYMKDHSMI